MKDRLRIMETQKDTEISEEECARHKKEAHELINQQGSFVLIHTGTQVNGGVCSIRGEDLMALTRMLGEVGQLLCKQILEQDGKEQ